MTPTARNPLNRLRLLRTLRRTLPAISPSSRLMRAVALFVYLACAFGFPIPTYLRTAADGQPFPCQQSQCGCSTAVQCWTSCCCTTLEQRVRWALENDVEIPSYAVLPPPAVMEQLVLAHATGLATVEHRCCDTHSNIACHHDHSCKSYHAPAADEPVAGQANGVEFVLGISAARCAGVDLSHWLVLAASTLPVKSVDWQPSVYTIWFHSASDHLWPSRSDTPLTPPPQVLS